MSMTPWPSVSEAYRAHTADRPLGQARDAHHNGILAPARSLPECGDRGAILDAPRGKKPLIRLSAQPPNYESPINYLRTVVTPNEGFFIRYNLSDIPRLDVSTWKLTVGGEGAGEHTELTLDDLRRLPAAEVVAVCQCSGNRRRLFGPQAPGIQWGHGAVGCARWRGARLKDVLDKVGLRKEALEIILDGADNDGSGETPDFIKSLPVWKSVEDTTLVAYEMNGEALPHLNGFPARIVVPGWTATYWVKHVTSIVAASKPFDGYWMRSTYRVPLGRFPTTAHFVSQQSAIDAPITEMMVNSVITSPEDGATVSAGAGITVAGVAWDGGHGIRFVELSNDGGKTWNAGELGEDLGPFAFRPWRCLVSFETRGPHVVMARATNAIGQTQPADAIRNPGGYHHNAVHMLTLVAT